MQVANLPARASVIKPPSQNPCIDCGAQATCYDHRDYSKPWAVEPVCDRCNTLRGPAKPTQGVSHGFDADAVRSAE